MFARQDLTKDPPFSRLDLILCRNVLIYMDTVLQKKLLSVFHYALNPGGVPVLGQAESVGAQATLFALIDKKLRIHRKKDGADRADADVPGRSRRRRRCRAASRRRRRRAGHEKVLQVEVSRADPRPLRAARRGGRRRLADRAVPRPDRRRSSSRRPARPASTC